MSKILKVFSFLGIVFLMSASYFVVTVINAKSEIYPYDTAKSYLYEFNRTYSTIGDLDLNSGKIRLAGKDIAGNTAFLKVDVETTLMGKYFQPSIELVSGESSVIQYFEHGAKGTRFINISSLLTKGEKLISLKGNYASVREGGVQLVSFKNRDVYEQKILVLAPHPDDAEIAAYGLYSDNNRSYVVTITAGEAGKYKYNELYRDRVQHYLKKGELRTWDSITVPLLGGIPPDNILNLGFFDLSLQKMFNEKSKEIGGVFTDISDINTFRKQNISGLARGLTGNSSWNSLVENLVYLLEKIKPDIIVTPYPALDTHPDHKLTTVALLEAIKTLGIRDGELYLYSNHFVLNEYYPYGKEGGTISLPPSFEDNIYYDRIYSHPLSSDKQKDKLFALEAMHDLRPDTTWRFSKAALKMALEQIERDVSGRENSYYKGSVRSNELFFVIDIKNIYSEDILKSLGVL